MRPSLFHHISIIIFYLVTTYVMELTTLFKRLLNACTHPFRARLFFTCLFTYFISTLFNLISCAKVRYLQSFVLIFPSKVELNGHLHIIMHFNIAKYTNYTGRILETIEPSRRNRGLKWVRNKMLGNSWQFSFSTD